MRARIVVCVVAAVMAAAMQVGNAAGSTRAPMSPTSPLLPLYVPYPAPADRSGPALDAPADVAEIRAAIVGAAAAGASGFILDWRNDVQSSERLRALAGVAAGMHFRLLVRYLAIRSDAGGIHASPVDRIAEDFESFRRQFASNPAFSWLGGRAALIWSGTTAYSRQSIAAVTSHVRPGLLVLATESSVAGYQRISELTDGDAPAALSGGSASAAQSAQLRPLADAVHAQGKYWVAPFGGSPGPTSVVVSYAAAIKSSPDALQLQTDGPLPRSLGELRFTVTPDPPTATDSSDSAHVAVKGEQQYNLVVLVGFPVALAILLGLIAHQRRSRRRRDGPRPR